MFNLGFYHLHPLIYPLPILEIENPFQKYYVQKVNVLINHLCGIKALQFSISKQDMVRLREEFLNTVKLKKSYEMSEEDLLLVLSEYRENQKNIIERRLDEKRRADQKLQERLLQRKTKALVHNIHEFLFEIVHRSGIV